MSLRAPWARVWRLQEERLRERRLARPERVELCEAAARLLRLLRARSRLASCPHQPSAAPGTPRS